MIQAVETALECLDSPATNCGSPSSGSAPPLRDGLVPRPSWRAATTDWRNPNTAYPLSSLHAELRLKIEMLATVAAATRRRLDAARDRDRAAAAQHDALQLELLQSRAVRTASAAAAFLRAAISGLPLQETRKEPCSVCTQTTLPLSE